MPSLNPKVKMIKLFPSCVRAALFASFLSLPALAQDAAPAPAAATAADAVEILPAANKQPLDELTQYFTAKTATVASGDKKVSLEYFWYPPDQPWAEGATFPLVLVLHGAAGYAEPGKALLTARKKFPAFIVVPALPQGQRWADPGKMKLSHALPEAVEIVKQLITENPAINPKRVYVIGCDTGGNGAFGAAQLYSDVFAAAVPVAATWSRYESDNMKNVAIAAFHGVDDKVVPYGASNDVITTVQASGGTAFFTRFDYMKHECEAPFIYTDLLWDWLFKQAKK